MIGGRGLGASVAAAGRKQGEQEKTGEGAGETEFSSRPGAGWQRGAVQRVALRSTVGPTRLVAQIAGGRPCFVLVVNQTHAADSNLFENAVFRSYSLEMSFVCLSGAFL